MPMRSFPNFKLIMSRHRKELRGALGHGLCVNPSLNASNTVSMVKQLNERQEKGQVLQKKVQQKFKNNLGLVTATNKLYVMT